ncbi:MAG TPA: GTP-binding protein, partial [Coriobacteriia bacterium]
MTSLVLGTAGHIDHGKSALVKALTGTDPDRLPEEKERGVTIELGFARLELPSGASMGVVDVPGHERFVRQMVAGATGIDVVLLVVAADDGVMPQTREHLAIIDLLGISRGVVAVTKSDLADPEWLAMVKDDIARLLVGTGIEGAPIVAVSSKTGEGLDELKAALDSVAG